jgi:hypothetical protein
VEGVPLSRETWDSIAASARSIGLDEARVRRALDRA